VCQNVTRLLREDKIREDKIREDKIREDKIREQEAAASNLTEPRVLEGNSMAKPAAACTDNDYRPVLNALIGIPGFSSTKLGQKWQAEAASQCERLRCTPEELAAEVIRFGHEFTERCKTPYLLVTVVADAAYNSRQPRRSVDGLPPRPAPAFYGDVEAGEPIPTNQPERESMKEDERTLEPGAFDDVIAEFDALKTMRPRQQIAPPGDPSGEAVDALASEEARKTLERYRKWQQLNEPKGPRNG